MRKVIGGLASLAIIAGTGAGMAATSAASSSTSARRAATAAPSVTPQDAPSTAAVDDLPNPLEQKRRALRDEAVTEVVNGEATPVQRDGSTVLKVGSSAGDGLAGARQAARGRKKPHRKDQYVELRRETTDRIFVILTEFGNDRHPDYPDRDTDPETAGPSTFEGPLHNAIPEPNRAVDNSTVWQPDYNRQHYQDLYFSRTGESVRTYYETQSSGRYSVDGQVTDWVKVPYNEARYGRSDGYPCDSNVCSNTWALVRDAANRWVADQLAMGRTEAQVKADMQSFDQWDRYDHDGDGDFNEPDGYIDHFQIVHAGGDQADGDPHQGEDAIWSHRWYAYINQAGITGPPQNQLGGTQIGNTGIWIGDYTIQPENGGLSVFVHEYGHDLGLPDDYDTSGEGDNSIEYWSLMAQSRLNAEGEPLGTRPGDLGAWNKLKLGWLNYAVVPAGQRKTVKLGPSEFNTAKPQAVIVPLPKKEVTTDLGDPYAGEHFFWSGQGDDLSNTLTTTVDLTGKTSASLSLQARYDIEEDFDYLYVQASTDGGATWTSLDGTVDGEPFPDDGTSPALTGTQPDWVPVQVPLDAYAGQTVQLRLLYRTDGGVAPIGFFADDITVTADGQVLSTNGAEAGLGDWVADGFIITDGSEVNLYDNYYMAASRTYTSFDRYLKTGPYNFGFPDKPDFVEHYNYQTGLLVNYWDLSQPDNNTNEHPGSAEVSVIDAHPDTVYNLQGEPWRARIQVNDAPFGLRPTDGMTLHYQGQASLFPPLPAKPVFDDMKKWYVADQPNKGVFTRRAGVTIRVLEESPTGATKVRIGVSPTAPPQP